jgi:signal transduction histidine kinase/ligand-binding sensor domain-containing protein/DNA-binding response OmpR family regulator
MSIYQDELGRIWFGTMEGVSMYDGERMQSFKPSGETQETGIGSANYYITGDERGNLYFMSDHSLVAYNLRRQTFTRLKENNVHSVSRSGKSLWVGCSDTLYTFDDNRQLHYFTDLKQPVGETQIQRVCTDHEGNVWIGTTDGLFCYRPDGTLEEVIPKENIYAIFEDSYRTLWVGTRYHGMYKRKQGEAFVYISHNPHTANGLVSNQVRCFEEDGYGNIWIGTFMGLNKYNPRTDTYTLYATDDLPGSLQHSSVFSLFKDRQGNIWVGTYYGGVNYFNPEKDIFTYYPANRTRSDCLNFPFVGNMVETDDNRLWICTEGGGLNGYNRTTKQFTHHIADGRPGSIAHNNLKSICYNAFRNELYIGTHTGGLSIYHTDTGLFDNYLGEDYPQNIAGNVINDIKIYDHQSLLLLTGRGLFRFDLPTRRVTPFFSHSVTTAHSFWVDAEKAVWIAGTHELYRIIPDRPEMEEIYPYGGNELEQHEVVKIFENRRQQLLLATRGSGLFLFDRSTKEFRQLFADEHSASPSFFYNMVQSEQGTLIASTDIGLLFIAPDLEKYETLPLHTLPISSINEGCGLLVSPGGEIFVGGTNGAVSFFEQDLLEPPPYYKLYFSNLYLNNHAVLPGDEHHVLTEALPYTKHVTLPHNLNSFSVDFTTNNYVSTLSEVSYDYCLTGYDQQWIRAAHNDIAYSHLPAGHYTLMVRENRQDNSHPTNIIRLDITVKPPFYATWWAYLIYLLTVTAIGWTVYQLRRRQQVLQESLEKERLEKEKNEEISNIKAQFFTNISHEFRTPLTLIISQLEVLMQNHSLSSSMHANLTRISKNAQKMRKLITELLDFRKLEQGHLKPEVREQDLTAFLREVYLSFYEHAANLSINYRFTAPDGVLMCRFDPTQMEKVFSNLLSNAFKYTKANGTVELVIDNHSDTDYAVKVIDSGIGIAPEHLNKIFDRFYQAGGEVRQSAGAGTGIGLALSRSIVESHGGNIEVNSTYGYGSIFTVHLLKGNSYFKDDELSTQALAYDRDTSEVPPLPAPDDESTGYKVLLVEDNEEMLQLLNTIFAGTYTVLTAHNGEEGIAVARRELPDIIVSDIMMPVMSGIELCMQIKNDFNICHIPVVLLTALTSPEQQMEGLQRGADDYISKPFSARELLTRCNNLVRNRIILQKKFGTEKEFNAQALASNPIDQKFLDSVNRMIEEHMEDENFDVDYIARSLALSRSSFYSKFKALTGVTPKHYVLNYKLKIAADLLTEHPELQIVEIGTRLGFSSSRYFSRCFKEKFGVSPAEYRKSGTGE